MRVGVCPAPSPHAKPCISVLTVDIPYVRLYNRTRKDEVGRKMAELTHLVSQIREATSIATLTPNKPEAKLRELVSPLWRAFLKEKRIDLNLQIRDEVTLANGRADTVFNKLILEYKKPLSIKPDNDRNRQLVSQVQGYILDLAKKERFSKERLLGVAFDGDHFLFMRYDKRWRTDEPLSVSEDSLELFLKNLEKLIAKKALIPENLIRDFAVGKESRNKVAVDCIKAFYQEVKEHGSEGDTKEHAFFGQWKMQFAEVHGSLEQKKIDRETLFTSYGFSKAEQKDFNVLAFFFALDSYFALLMKLLAYQVVGFYTFGESTGLPLHDWENMSSEDLRHKCEDLEEGGIYRDLQIRNFLEGDLFSWYNEAWNEPIYRAIRQIINHLNDYDPETMEVAPDQTRDILKKLYQYLVPKQIRHDLGEYYTPDWLAERCLNQVGYGEKRQDLNTLRILDPACGSGTFLVLVIKRLKENAKQLNISPADVLRSILRNIHGFDLNPLAVTAARTNYMLAIADLLKYRTGETTIPVYFCDSIKPPEGKIDESMPLFPEKLPYLVKTTVGDFYFSHSIVSKQRVQQLANIMEDCVKARKEGVTKQDFLNKVKKELKLNEEEYQESELYLDDAYDKLVKIDERGINGIWARIVKNYFAPLFVGQFDMIAGNPPWVNWESLPSTYRDETKPLWVDYGLFSLKGHEARLGGGKKDISMLMTYVAIDKYLKDKGKLCFVITQTLFKSQGAGDGFRRFRLGESGSHFEIEQVDDMVALQPFEGATNRTSVFLATKGQQTKYPLSYVLWRKLQKGSIPMDLTLKEVQDNTRRSHLKATPVGESNTSPWLHGRERAIAAAKKKCIGKSFYQAYAGSYTGGMNGIYWVEILDKTDGLIRIRNLWDEGEKKVKPVEMNIEPDLLYPLLRGKDVSKWFTDPKASIIVAQDPSTRTGYAEDWMHANLPETHSYFKAFEDDLWTRKTSSVRALMERGAFYSMFAVGPYTFAPYKVVWKYIASELTCAVISKKNDEFLGEKLIIPDHRLIMVNLDNETEAYFVCAVLNSSISRFIVASYCVGTQLAPHILGNIVVPKFEPSNSVHNELSLLSQDCHAKTAAGIDVSDLEERIDELAAELWGLTSQELQDITDSLKELL